MHKLALAIFLAFTATVSSAQMMGGPGSPMSTAAYFPLVDGARYEYRFLRGAQTTATAAMHTGQTWAGMSGLTALHMHLECTDNAPCTGDREDFYAMGADGVRWYGGSSSTPEGAHHMTSLSSPEWLIKNPVTPGTMMSGGTGYQNAEQWQMSVSGMNTTMGTVAYSSMYQAMGLETVVIPAGTFANCLRVREKRGSGYERDVWYAAGVGMVRWSDANEEAVLVKMHTPTEPPANVSYAVEYHHAGLDHYFITANASEIAAVDGGRFAGWQRTGLGVRVVDAADTRSSVTVSVCRLLWPEHMDHMGPGFHVVFLLRLRSGASKKYTTSDATLYLDAFRDALSEFRADAVYLTHARHDLGHEIVHPPAAARPCRAPTPDRAAERRPLCKP